MLEERFCGGSLAIFQLSLEKSPVVAFTKSGSTLVGESIKIAQENMAIPGFVFSRAD